MRSALCLTLVGIVVGAVAPVRADGVQAPEIKPPGRGSLAGQYGSTAFGTADLSRGSFSLPGPFNAPTERGPLLADIFPHYSPDHGISEWGLGWSTTLAITRFRVSGDLDYRTDELTSPWGRLSHGADGNWYPDGLTSLVRIMPGAGDTLLAWLPDGTQMTFGGVNRVMTAGGTWAWFLTEVQSATGEKTLLSYGKNSSGRLFLQSVSYGGWGDDFQDQIELQYEPVQLFTVSYAPGAEYMLDRRVKGVTVRTKNAATSQLVERWHYTLKYLDDPWGPAFYLTEVDQTFAGGDSPPPVKYTYNSARDHLAAALLKPVPKLDPILQQFYETVVQPTGGTPLDIDSDGRVDIEEATGNILLRQTDTGFTQQSPPPGGATAYFGCRESPSPLNVPRTLAQLASGDDYQVLDLEVGPAVTQTTMYVCDRSGNVIGSQLLDGSWTLSPTTRLVDLDRDHQPDLVQLFTGQYSIRPNTSSGGTFSFGPEVSGTLQPVFTPDAMWVHDFNGDGLADLVASSSSALTVWFGKGNYQFVSEGQVFDVYQTNGLSMDLSQVQLQMLDANRDGLTDLLLTSPTSAQLFVNNGFYFAEQPIPALEAAWDVDTSQPVVTDLAGTGNTEVLVTRLGHASSISVDGPEVGLLATADDGRGNVVRFTYDRSAPAPGERQRATVLARLDITTTGADDLSVSYSFGQPTLHSVGRYLLGFGQVTRQAPTSTTATYFFFDDDVGGLPIQEERTDSFASTVHAFDAHQYQPEVFQGIRWMRKLQDRTGWSSADASRSIDEKTDYLAYDADFCPSRIQKQTAAGTLTTTTTRANLPGLAYSLHCLDARSLQEGSHSDHHLDFRHEQQIDRTPIGLVQKTTHLGSLGPLVLQQVNYNADNTIASISSPANGVAMFGWNAKTHLLESVIAPDGSSTTIADRDPNTDSIQQIISAHGVLSASQWFRYDGQERLMKQWDGLGQATETNPNQILAYRFATATRLASIAVRTLIDSAAGSALREVDLELATGAPLTHARLVPQGWVFDAVATQVRSKVETAQWMRPPLSTTLDPTSLDLPSLLAGTQLVHKAHASSFGFQADTLDYFHADVSRVMETQVGIVAGALSQVSIENTLLRTTLTLDAGRRVIGYEDPGQVRYGYGYDALGRLRVVSLPDGTGHRLDVDEYARDLRVIRDGIGTIEYGYDPITGRLRTGRYSGADGQPVRAVSFGYDTIGRKTSERDDDLVKGASQTFVWYYDGATPLTPGAHGTPGLLTAVAGDGFTKEFVYRVDGRLLKQTSQLAGWRSVETDLDYGEGGAPRGHTTILRAADGTLLSSSHVDSQYDAYGRVAGLTLNGGPLAALSYDGNGLLQAASLAGGATISFSYDPLTRADLGFTQATPQWTAQNAIKYDARGLIGAELVSLANQSVTRSYSYSPRAFLTGSVDATSTFQYDYDLLGLPTQITDSSGSRVLAASAGTLAAGTVQYHFDPSGRTIARDDLELSYGPSGQIESAQRGSSQWTFKYDEGGQRILKAAAGQPIAAYLGDLFLDGNGLVEPVKLGSTTIGVLQDGAFRLIPLDRRGTLLGDADGTARLPSPFGDRASHPELSAALDYVTKGYDADLGIVRMGLRDYDPRISRFWTPDPLFLAKPALCLESPTECALYGYVRNNPVQAVDPNGTCSDVTGCFVSKADREAMSSREYNNFEKALFNLIPETVHLFLGGSNANAPRSERVAHDAPRSVSDTAFVLRLSATLAVGAAVGEGFKLVSKWLSRGARSLEGGPAGELVNLASPKRTGHILNGDATGGGHLWPGQPGKTPFPRNWSGTKIMHEVSDVATDPSLAWVQQTGRAGSLFTKSGAPARFVVKGIRDSVGIKVVIEPAGEGIITAHPF